MEQNKIEKLLSTLTQQQLVDQTIKAKSAIIKSVRLRFKQTHSLSPKQAFLLAKWISDHSDGTT